MINFTSPTTTFEIPSSVKIELKARPSADGTPPIDVTKMPFYFEFYDNSDKKYVVSFDGTTRVNNSARDGKLFLVFEDYPWRDAGGGTLRYRQWEIFPDKDFPDGTSDSWTSGTTNIMLRRWK